MTTSVHDRTAEFLVPVRRRRVAIVTPEGVQLDVEIASLAERAGAFLTDVALIVATNLVLVLLIAFIAGAGFNTRLFHGHARLVFAITGLIAFLVRTLYFVRFELVWQGATPGKRFSGLRVINRHGGPLTPSAVITRNITREVEIFLPLGAFLGAASGGWGGIGLALWLILLASVPLWTRTRQRAGDILAGTIVIAMPGRVLLPDLVVAAEQFSFSETQLRAYGAFELQVLEEILRRPESPATQALRADVCARICKRIDAPAVTDTARFLAEFYAAERAFLEREQLFGRK